MKKHFLLLILPFFFAFIKVGLALGPVVTVSPHSLLFGNVVAGTSSAEQSYTVSGTNLSSNIVITPTQTYCEISLTSGSGFSSSPITLTQSGGTVNTTTIYVRWSPLVTGFKSALINNANVGATTQIVDCSGTGVNPNLYGNVYNDLDGSAGLNKVDGTGLGQPGGTQLYATLVQSGVSYLSTAVNPGGSYAFMYLAPGVYTVLISTTNYGAGINNPTASLPSGWIFNGEINNDGTNSLTGNTSPTDGSLAINFTAYDSNVNFGIIQNVSPPTVNPGGPDNVCQSAHPSAITLNGASIGGSATTGAWSIFSGGGTLSNTNPTASPETVTYTPAANFSGIVTLTLTIDGTPAASGTRTISVNALPSVNPITGNPSVCVGLTTQLADATPGGTWASASTEVATINASTGLVTGIAAGTSVITYTTTADGNGCTNSITQTVTVNAPPIVAVISGTLNVCVGSTTQLADATPGGSWSSGSTGVATVSASSMLGPGGLVSGLTPGTSVITYSVTNSCGTTSVTQTVTVNALPIPTLSSSDADNIFCAGTSVIFTAGGGTNYNFRVDGTSVQNGASTTYTTAALTNGQIVDVIVTNASGCIVTSSGITNTVNDIPAIAAITGTAAVCVGSSTQLADATSGGNWTSASTGVATINASTGLVTGVSAGTSLITYTTPANGSGCTNSIIQLVTVDALPVVSAAGSVNVGSTITLSPTTGGTWISSNPSVATVTNAGLVTGVSAGTATFTFTTTITGCSATTSSVSVEDCNFLSNTGFEQVINVASPTTFIQTPEANIPYWHTTASNHLIEIWNGAGMGVPAYEGIQFAELNCTEVGTLYQTFNAVSGKQVMISFAHRGRYAGLDKMTVSIGPVGGPYDNVGSYYDNNTAWSYYSVPYTFTGSGSYQIRFISVYSNGGAGPAAGGNFLDAITVECPNPFGGTVTPGGPDNVCQSASPSPITLSGASIGGSATAGAWSIILGGGTLSSTAQTATPASITYTPAANYNGTVILKLTTNSTPAISATRTITINALPTVAAITGTSSVCVGSTIQLADVTSGGNWTSGSTGVATVNASTGLVSGITAGTSDITYTVANGGTGCTNSVTKTVTVNALPGPIITGSATACAGEIGSVYSVTDITGHTYSWTVGGGTITAGAGTNSVTVTWGTAGTGTLNVTETITATTCAAPATQKTVIISALPTIAAITGTLSVCAGSTIQLADVTSGGNWTSGTTGVATVNASTGLVTGITAGTSDITYTVANGGTGCTNSVTKTVTVIALPDPIITGSATACAGEIGSVYSVTDITGHTYSWTVGGGTITAGAGTNSVTVTWGAAGTGTLNVTETITATTCAAPATQKTVIISALPTIAAITGTSSVCVGSTIQLADVTSGGNWTSGSTGVATVNASTGLVTGITAGTSDITYTVANGGTGCTNSVTKTVTVNALPGPIITGSATACAGEIGSVYSVTDITGHTYSWTVGGGTITAGAGTNSVTVTWGAAGTGTLNVTETITATTCAAPATQKTIIISALPTIAAITGTSSVCVGSTIQLADVTSGGNWTSGSTGVATVNASTGLVTGITAGTSDITYTIANGGTGCTNSVTKTVIVNALPDVPIIGTLTQPTCASATGSVVLSGLPSGNWTLNPGAITGSTASTTISGLTAGTYNYTVTNSAGCVSLASANVVINTQPVTPAAPIIGTITQPTCAVPTGSVVLSGLPSGNWVLNPGAITGSTTSTTISGLAAGTYNFTVTSASGCTSTASANVVINTQPSVPVAPTANVTLQPTCSILTGTITISSIITGLSFSIDGSGYTNTTGIFTSVSPGNHIITAKSPSGCMSSETSITINSIPDCVPVAVNDVNTTNEGTPVNGDASINDAPGGDSVNSWSLIGVNGGSTDGIVTMKPDGTYTYTPNANFSGVDIFNYQLCNANGTCDQAIVTITVIDVVIPNQIFTPNNDGQNDTFYIAGIELYPNNKLTIYNRWGNVVYQKSGYLNEWDGYSNMNKIGKTSLPIGTYFYVLDFGNQLHKTGFIYLDR